MKKNIWIWAVAGLILLVGLVIGNILSRQKEPMKRKPETMQKPIPVIAVQNRDINIPIKMSGPLYAYNKVDIYAEVSGVLLNTNKPFKAGISFKKNEVLIKIDDRVYKNNVLAQKSSLLNQITLLLPDLSIDFPKSSSRWEKYLAKMDIEKALSPLPEPLSDKEKYYIAARNIYTLYYQIKSMETTLSKYTIRAPFNGVVSQSQINPGTLVRVGQVLGEFINTELYEMEASVDLFAANLLEIGQNVNLHSEDLQGTFTGKIQRINHVLDTESLTVKVFIHLKNPRLRDGMYMVAETEGKPIKKVFTVSKELLVDESHIYAVEDSVLKLKPVRVVAEQGDTAILRGLEDGEMILGKLWAEAREGLKINGKVQPLKKNLPQHTPSKENED